MLKIRLQRIGRKNDPAFRVVLTDSKNSTKSGKFLEILGTYNPKLRARNLVAPRIKYWLSQGAQCSATMHNFLVHDKLIEGKKKIDKLCMTNSFRTPKVQLKILDNMLYGVLHCQHSRYQYWRGYGQYADHKHCERKNDNRVVISLVAFHNLPLSGKQNYASRVHVQKENTILLPYCQSKFYAIFRGHVPLEIDGHKT